jgi:signal transduction histidine kinase
MREVVPPTGGPRAMSGDHATSATTTIDRLERLMRELDLICPEADRLGVIAQARDDASGLRDGAAVELAASLLVLCARSSSPPDAGRLKRLVTETGIPGMALLRETMRTPELVMLDPALAYRMATSLLAGCAPVVEMSLWIVDENQQPRCSASAGKPVGEELARQMLCGARESPDDGELVATAAELAGEPLAVLVVRPAPGAAIQARSFAREVTRALLPVLERETLLARNEAGERALSAAGERRIARLGYDLHDGPLQELLLLSEDLAMLREQLTAVLDGRRGKEQLAGRIDDLDARLLALERALRNLSSQSSALSDRPFADALDELIEPFAARTQIVPEVTLQGDLESVSASQRIAVLSVVGEALSNIRDHSRASEVGISVTLLADGLHASVRDDGRGFDVERELMDAARRGRIGLAGMHERVRLLGGRCRLDSRPGGPTEIALVLPPWRPASGGTQSDAPRTAAG